MEIRQGRLTAWSRADFTCKRLRCTCKNYPEILEHGSRVNIFVRSRSKDSIDRLYARSSLSFEIAIRSVKPFFMRLTPTTELPDAEAASSNHHPSGGRESKLEWHTQDEDVQMLNTGRMKVSAFGITIGSSFFDILDAD